MRLLLSATIVRSASSNSGSKVLLSCFRIFDPNVVNTIYNIINETSIINPLSLLCIEQRKCLLPGLIGFSRPPTIGVTEVRSGCYIHPMVCAIVVPCSTMQPSIVLGQDRELPTILVSPSIVGIYPWVLVVLGICRVVRNHLR